MLYCHLVRILANNFQWKILLFTLSLSLSFCEYIYAYAAESAYKFVWVFFQVFQNLCIYLCIFILKLWNSLFFWLFYFPLLTIVQFFHWSILYCSAKFYFYEIDILYVFIVSIRIYLMMINIFCIWKKKSQ